MADGPQQALRELRVDTADDGERLDRTLSRAIDGWSRSRVQRAIKEGRVRIGGEPVVRPREPVRAGDVISIELDDAREVSTDVAGRRIDELSVLYEDETIVVIDKPAGLVTHPNPRQTAGTVSDLAVARYGPLPEVQGANRPGVVHRLDRLTSGVLVLGRTAAALDALKRQFQERTVEKTYLAIVHGVPRFDTEWLTGAIAPSAKSPDRMRVVTGEAAEELLDAGEARTAETFLETLEPFGHSAYVSAKPKTGRTHQIRVHLSAAGHPIVGDRVYRHGGTLKTPLPRQAPALERPALHARELSLDHPVTGERVTFRAELPADFAGLLEWLRGAR